MGPSVTVIRLTRRRVSCAAVLICYPARLVKSLPDTPQTMSQDDLSSHTPMMQQCVFLDFQ
jgi:hypothetical protein